MYVTLSFLAVGLVTVCGQFQNQNFRPFQNQNRFFQPQPQQRLIRQPQQQPQQFFRGNQQQNPNQFRFQPVNPNGFQQQRNFQANFRPQPQPQQQFVPRPQPVNIPRPVAPAPKKDADEVDPASLNPPTKDNPSPTNAQGRRFLAQPNPQLCAARKIHKTFGGKGYYMSWLDPEAQRLQYDWLDARNYCRQRCQDTIAIESEPESRFVQENILDGFRKGIVEHVWTSGRVCDFKGCEDREDLKPIRVKGWFWSSTNQKIGPVGERSGIYEDWSKVGGFPGQGQPDNRQADENCIALLDPRVYKEPDNGFHWHDVKCSFTKSMLCEDNEALLGFARQSSGINIP